MKMPIKIALTVFSLGILSIGIFIYLMFNGNPITKQTISLQEKKYAEKKYGFQMKLLNSDYDFENGSYRATLAPIKSHDTSFMVYQEVQPGGEKAFLDTYPEVLWGKEVKTKTLPTIKKIFPDTSNIDIYVPTGSGYLLPSNTIPSYLEIEKVPFHIELSLKKTHFTANENKRIVKMIEYLKKENLNFGEIFLRYANNKTIYIPADELALIQSEENLLRYE